MNNTSQDTIKEILQSCSIDCRYIASTIYNTIADSGNCCGSSTTYTTTYPNYDGSIYSDSSNDYKFATSVSLDRWIERKEFDREIDYYKKELEHLKQHISYLESVILELKSFKDSVESGVEPVKLDSDDEMFKSLF